MFPTIFVDPHEDRSVEISAFYRIYIIPDDKVILIICIKPWFSTDGLERHEWSSQAVFLLPLLVHVVADVCKHLAETFSALLL